MEVFHDKADFARACSAARARGARVGLVPTMGALHRGHTSLMDAAREAGATYVATTIFVNPLQFAEGEDLGAYPRTLEADLEACREHGVHAVFAPAKGSMYAADFSTRVRVDDVSAAFEGEYRPEHFEGVTTVVTKLFNLCGPCTAIFGRKDYQQWRTIQRLVRDLDMPIEVHGAPIVREADGLALSSRNVYLTPDERERATAIRRGLVAAERAWKDGERDLLALVSLARSPVEDAFDRIDYVDAAEAASLAPLTRNGELLGRSDRAVVLLVAAHIGRTRLLDNLELG